MPSFLLAEARSTQELSAAQEFLAQEQIANAQLNAMILRRLHHKAANPRMLMACKEGYPVALATMGPFIHLTDGPHAAIGALGKEIAGRTLEARAICGTPQAIDDFIAGYSEKRIPPKIEIELLRDVWVCRRAPAIPAEDETKQLNLRLATHDDRDFIAEGVAALVMQDFGYDPRTRPHYSERLDTQIKMHSWWIAEDSERRFICQVNAATDAACRLENLWVPPSSRRHGYATRALRMLLTELLKQHRMVSLSVGVDNAVAKRLYKVVGFELHGSERVLVFQRQDCAETVAPAH